MTVIIWELQDSTVFKYSRNWAHEEEREGGWPLKISFWLQTCSMFIVDILLWIFIFFFFNTDVFNYQDYHSICNFLQCYNFCFSLLNIFLPFMNIIFYSWALLQFLRFLIIFSLLKMQCIITVFVFIFSEYSFFYKYFFFIFACLLIL